MKKIVLKLYEFDELSKDSLAYTEDQFMKLIQDNGITYNDVIQRGWI